MRLWASAERVRFAGSEVAEANFPRFLRRIRFSGTTGMPLLETVSVPLKLPFWRTRLPHMANIDMPSQVQALALCHAQPPSKPECPVLGAKQTSISGRSMSAYSQKRTFAPVAKRKVTARWHRHSERSCAAKRSATSRRCSATNVHQVLTQS